MMQVSVQWLLILFACLTNGQSFDPSDTQSTTQFDPSHVGTNKSTNATYSNPIMTTNAGDP